MHRSRSAFRNSSAQKPKKNSESVPNCTVLVVTAKVAAAADARERLIDNVDFNPLRAGKRQRRRIELRMKASDRHDKVGVVAIGQQHAHLAFNA